MGNMIMEIMKQAHDNEAYDTDDPTTVDTNKKEVKDPALEPEVADGERLDCEHCGEQYNQKADVEKHMSSMHEADISFECIKCGAYNKDKIVTNGHVKSQALAVRSVAQILQKRQVRIYTFFALLDVKATCLLHSQHL